MTKQKEFWNIMLLIFSSYKKKITSDLNMQIMYKTRDVEYGRVVLI